MKNIIGLIGSWSLYVVGDLISKPMCYFEAGHLLYPTYNKLMITSSDVQDWSGCDGPWGDK